MLKKIITGGQTGVDRAAMDTALDLGFEVGGWCPKGRRADDGLVPEKYVLQETSSRDYEQRTEWNVRDSDGLLVLATGRMDAGTQLAIDHANLLNRPFFVVNLLSKPHFDSVHYWLEYEKIGILNVAGPRESRVPGIRSMAMAYLKDLLLYIRS